LTLNLQKDVRMRARICVYIYYIYSYAIIITYIVSECKENSYIIM